MKPLPKKEDPLIIRTDFSNRPAWEKVQSAIQKPYGNRSASVVFVDDLAYQGITKDDLLHLERQSYTHSFIILVDQIALSTLDFPLLVVDLSEDPGREFRTIPSEIYGIESNLRLSNMDFHEFADNVDDDGIFRGFSWFPRKKRSSA